jgi:hypothetical protein
MVRAADDVSIAVSDMHGARVVNWRAPSGASVQELIEATQQELGLPRQDLEGRAYTYHARLEREGRHLLATEMLGDVLEPDDHVVLQPHISAGGK